VKVNTGRESQRTRLIAGYEGNDRVRSPVREQNPQRAAERRQHYAFRQKLPYYACAARAQSQPYGHFLLPRGCASEHQTRNIRASNQQNDPHSEHQDVQGIGILAARAGQPCLRRQQRHFWIIGDPR